MNVRGLVRDLEDGSVEIFAEIEEGVLERFLKAIDVKGRAGDVLSLNVEKIEVRREGEPGYTGPWRPYGLFEIDYGVEVARPVEREIFESLRWAKLYFTKLVSEFTGYRQEFRDYREEFREFRNESLKMNKQILDEVRELRIDLKTILDEWLTKMEKNIAEIKAKIGLI